MSNHCSADILLDSINAFGGARLTTFLVRCPLYLYSRLVAHRSLTVTRSDHPSLPEFQVKYTPFMPAWGADLDAGATVDIIDLWRTTAQDAWETSSALRQLGVPAHLAERVLAPFQAIYVVISGTEWASFFHYATQADDEILRELAWRMADLYYQDIHPVVVRPGGWHAPLVDDEGIEERVTSYLAESQVTWSDAWQNVKETYQTKLMLRLSAARLAILTDYVARPVDQLRQTVNETSFHTLTGLSGFMEDGFMSPKWLEHVAQATHKKDQLPGNYQGWNQLRGTLKPTPVTFNYAERRAALRRSI